MRKRALIIMAMAALFPVGLAVPASADIPDNTRLPGAPVAAGAPHQDDVVRFCDLPGSVLIRDVVNNRTATTTELADGSVVTVTKGELIQSINYRNITITRDVSGTTTETVSADGTTLTLEGGGGNLFLVGPNGRRNTSLPAIAYTNGDVTATVSINPETGVRTVQTFEFAGTPEDICTLLATY